MEIQTQQRVRARTAIDGYVSIPRGWEGTVVDTRDNGLGEDLYYVQWDVTGEKSPVFLFDIEFLL